MQCALFCVVGSAFQEPPHHHHHQKKPYVTDNTMSEVVTYSINVSSALGKK